MRKTGIKTMRKRKGLTQAELARLMNVHQTNIVAWEKGKWFPIAARLKRLAEILGCTVDELLKEDDV